jgi:hypothetical protein
LGCLGRPGCPGRRRLRPGRHCRASPFAGVFNYPRGRRGVERGGLLEPKQLRKVLMLLVLLLLLLLMLLLLFFVVLYMPPSPSPRPKPARRLMPSSRPRSPSYWRRRLILAAQASARTAPCGPVAGMRLAINIACIVRHRARASSSPSLGRKALVYMQRMHCSSS